MTVKTESGARTAPGGRAVVLGASMGGLLAARALSESFTQVTIIDRDELPTVPADRKGVPQGEQSHGLLARGREIMEELFPGLSADLIAHGAVAIDCQRDAIWINEGHHLRRAPSDLQGLCVSRPMLETYLRRRVATLSNVDIVERCEALGLVATEDRTRITGVRVLRSGSTESEVFDADLVVDATGRGNRGPTWLGELGYPAPAEEVVKTGIVYVTREYRREPGQTNFDVVLISAYPANPRGAVALAAEGDRWQVTLFALNNDSPPVDPADFEEFAAGLASTEVLDLIRVAQPLTAPKRFRIPASVRRRYERLDRLPAGYVPFADAICAFNPAYGQGMSVAAAEAMVLRDSLRQGRNGFERRFLTAASRVINVPWDIAVGADLAYPFVEGKRTRKAQFLNAYVARLHRAAQHDAVVGLAFLKTVNLTSQPQQLFAPRILWRVLRYGRQGLAAPNVERRINDVPHLEKVL